MGVIQRQTLKNNVLAYAAVAIGAVASIWIYPEVPALKGHADAILKYALLLTPPLSLAMTVVIGRLSPYYGENLMETSNRLMARGLLASLGLITFLAVLNLLVSEHVVEWVERAGYGVGKFAEYSWHILAIVAFMSSSAMITAHLANFKRVAVPVIFNNIFPKVLLPAALLLALYGWLNRASFSVGLIIIYGSITAGLLLYALRLGVFRPNLGKLTLPENSYREMISVAGFGIFGSIGSVLTTHLDTVMVNGYLGDDLTTVYSFGIFITVLIAIPARGVNAIVRPIVAKAWKERDVEKLAFLYRESAAVLFAVGGVIFTGIVVCVPYVYQITAKTSIYATGFWVTVFLGISQLFDQMTSINSTLVTYTDYYRWNIVFIVLIGLLNVFFNLYFMEVLALGLNGAAIATMLSIMTYNVVKGIFIYWKMGVHPLSWSQLFSAVVLFLIGCIAYFLPLGENVWVNLIVRGGSVVLLSLLYFRFTGAVPPLRNVLTGGMKKMF